MFVLSQTVEVIVEDHELVSRICAGEEELFSLVYDRYYSKTYRLAYAMCGHSAQAEDLTQEIFLRVFESLDTFRGEASFATWFYRISLNHCLNYCRRTGWRQRFIQFASESKDHAVFQIQASEHFEANVLRREIQERIRCSLLSLKPQIRMLVILRDIEGFTYEEIANQLQCSIGTVASGISRGRKLLAKKLEGLRGNI